MKDTVSSYEEGGVGLLVSYTICSHGEVPQPGAPTHTFRAQLATQGDLEKAVAHRCMHLPIKAIGLRVAMHANAPAGGRSMLIDMHIDRCDAHVCQKAKIGCIQIL